MHHSLPNLCSASGLEKKTDYFDIDKAVSRGAFFVERVIRTLKKASGVQALGGPCALEPLAPLLLQCANPRRHHKDDALMAQQ